MEKIHFEYPATSSAQGRALAGVVGSGDLEVLVEAGPTLTGYMLASGLWDEHVRITRHGAADGTDHVEIRHIAA